MMANTIARARPVRLAAGDRALSPRTRRPGAASSHFYVACFLLAIALVFYPSDAYAQKVECGFTPHWVDNCPAGTDETDNSGAVVGIDTPDDGNLDCEADHSFVLHGPTVIDRKQGDPQTHSIATEILTMDLNGGAVRICVGKEEPCPNSGAILPASTGFITQRGDPFILADSFFEVFFEVDIGELEQIFGFRYLYNHDLLEVTALISRVPPPNDYIHPTDCTPLYDAQVGGTHVANLAEARHTLAIRMPSFSAAPRPGAIELSWKTEVELESNGFNVLRSTIPDGRFQKVNPALIAAGGGPAFGAAYQFTDDSVAPHTSYYYLLEDVDTSGVRTLHGAGACKMNADPQCRPLAVTSPPKIQRPKGNPHD